MTVLIFSPVTAKSPRKPKRPGFSLVAIIIKMGERERGRRKKSQAVPVAEIYKMGPLANADISGVTL